MPLARACFTCNVNNFDWEAFNKVRIRLCAISYSSIYGESVVTLSRWRANVKSPITTRHCRPRKSFVRQELEADSVEKLGRKFSLILRTLSLVSYRCNFGIQISSCHLAIYRCVQSKLRYPFPKWFNIILQKLSSRSFSPFLFSSLTLIIKTKSRIFSLD